MASKISKTQIDRLGDRLRKGDITEADLRFLDEYRRSFGEAYEIVVTAIQNELGLEPTGRPAKSTTSITEKLLRESIRLTQIQDIAGCRIIVSEISDQERGIESLNKLFGRVAVVDRRELPSHGYRAVHLIITHGDRLVEIQIRTSLQHLWAELSEKLSDLVDPAIKYGGGEPSIRNLLSMSSDLVSQEESQELQLTELRRDLPGLPSSTASEDERQRFASFQTGFAQAWNNQVSIREHLFDFLRDTVDKIKQGGMG